MGDIDGWLLDLYEDPVAGLKLWLILENGERKCFLQRFPVTFYVWGPGQRLHELCLWLAARPEKPRLTRVEKLDLFKSEPLEVLAAQVDQPGELYALFRETQERYPDLTYYDADVQVHVRHSARYGTFPLARIHCEVDANDQMRSLEVLDSRWELDPGLPDLRIMEIGLDCDPHHRAPRWMEAYYLGRSYRIPWPENDPPAFWARALLQRYDPDILVTDYGDT